MAGVGAAARSVGASVLGGDLVRSPRYLVDVCVLGVAQRPVRRSGARPGDGLWVTGRLGGAGLALAALQRGGGPRLPRPLFRRFARPAPRIAAGRWLARRGARALIDISDGLAGDAGQLAAASGVRAEIALEWLPCWPGVTPRAAALSGEEYELLAAAGTPVRVEGLERIPRDGPVVYASNHSSMFDIWALAATLPGSVRFVGKQELVKIPLLGRAMVTAGHVVIDRPHPRRAVEAYARAGAVIKGGVSAVVFPEGTRSRTGELLPFKNAPFGLAVAAQVPVVPVDLHHTS